MKKLIGILVVLMVVSVAFTFAAGTDTEKKAEKAACCKAEKAACCKAEKAACCKAEKKECTEIKCCCVVCKKELPKDAAEIKAEYKGKTYFFTSAECKAEFEKNPEKYTVCCAKSVSYVCPMKQCNVKSDKPGKCPKCGMELKKAQEHKHAEAKHGDKAHEHKGDHKH